MDQIESEHLIAAIKAMFLALDSNDRVKTLKQLSGDFCKSCGLSYKNHGDYCY